MLDYFGPVKFSESEDSSMFVGKLDTFRNEMSPPQIVTSKIPR